MRSRHSWSFPKLHRLLPSDSSCLSSSSCCQSYYLSDWPSTQVREMLIKAKPEADQWEGIASSMWWTLAPKTYAATYWDTNAGCRLRGFKNVPTGKTVRNRKSPMLQSINDAYSWSGRGRQKFFCATISFDFVVSEGEVRDFFRNTSRPAMTKSTQWYWPTNPSLLSHVLHHPPPRYIFPIPTSDHDYT
jgi:hypothetical protein